MKEYKAMDLNSVVEYVKGLNLDIFKGAKKLTSKEIGDGNLNLVFRIKDEESNKSVVVKQALPYLKIAGAGWKLTLERNRIEAETMLEQDRVCKNSVPKIYHYDNVYSLYVAEDLGKMDMLRNGLMSMKTYPKFPSQIGQFLAKNLFYTSDFGLGAIDKKKNVSRFINPELCDITERLVLTDPYMNAESNDINPNIMDDAKKLWENKDVRLEITKLKNIFMNKAEALLHGDLHTGSIFITEDDMRVFDAEFAFYGPYGYDIGLLFANFLLNYASWEGRTDKTKDEIKEYRKYLLRLIEDVWNEFEKCFREVWAKDSKEITTNVEGYLDYYINNLLHETIGFSSCEIIRRVIGMAHVPDLDKITDLVERAKAQKLALNIGQTILLNRNNVKKIEEITKIISEVE